MSPDIVKCHLVEGEAKSPPVKNHFLGMYIHKHTHTHTPIPLMCFTMLFKGGNSQPGFLDKNTKLN